MDQKFYKKLTAVMKQRGSLIILYGLYNIHSFKIYITIFPNEISLLYAYRCLFGFAGYILTAILGLAVYSAYELTFRAVEQVSSCTVGLS